LCCRPALEPVDLFSFTSTALAARWRRSPCCCPLSYVSAFPKSRRAGHRIAHTHHRPTNASSAPLRHLPVTGTRLSFLRFFQETSNTVFVLRDVADSVYNPLSSECHLSRKSYMWRERSGARCAHRGNTLDRPVKAVVVRGSWYYFGRSGGMTYLDFLSIVGCVCVCLSFLLLSSKLSLECLFFHVNQGGDQKVAPQVTLYEPHTTEESLRRRRSGRHSQALPDHAGQCFHHIRGSVSRGTSPEAHCCTLV